MPAIETEQELSHKVVSHEEWMKARAEFLVREKEFTHARKRMSEQLRKLPWERVEKEYVFEREKGKVTLAELFDGRSQLVIYHFMFGPEWTEGCPGCSFMADHIDGPNQHLPHHDVTLMAVSHAPYSKLGAYRKRMGWRFPWASSDGSDFNHDFGVSFTKEELAKKKVYYNYAFTNEKGYQSEELPGLSVFYKNEVGEIFHTYSTYARGIDILIGTHHFLDLTPKGRNETGPDGQPMDWVRRHDQYDKGASDACCQGAETRA